MSDDDLYLEKLKIVDRLQAVENTLISHTAEMKLWREQTQKLLDKHSHEIWGNGSPGLKTNMDRMIQTEDGRKWFLRSFYGVVLSLVLKAGWEIFRR